ncbi:hypothetical protein THRCLA_07609 [Thraustotheca clavata]|uniref:Equilibrative Nucleoside Transporter (ENT) Family n=1 Tax=Thraustotheca clavata TaxID=74557 RepID=A0A1V9ZCL7_9STRA|nr:hypothetical protein THRCLA_07609 [Thraustotheca clavata]
MSELKVHSTRKTYIAFVGFGLGSWVVSDFVFAQFAALMQQTPEGYSIGAYVIVSLQSANIFPMLYMLLNSRQHYISIPTMIWGLLVLGMIACSLLAVFWNSTTTIGGHLHSTALFALIFCGGAVSATSTVVFYPFAAAYPVMFTSALATGESFGAVIAGVLAIIQDVGSSKMNFSVGVAFLCGAVLFLFSFLSFAYLRRQHKSIELVADQELLMEQAPTEHKDVLRVIWRPLLCQWLLAVFSFAVIPSILPILGGKYKNAPVVMKWTSILGMLCDPAARFLSGFYRTQRVELFTVAALFFALWLTVWASYKEPIWCKEKSGGVVVVVANCLYTSLSAFTQTSLYSVLKNIDANHKLAYQWSGFTTQMGALIGTAVIFCLVTLTNAFPSSY